jgi:hypothetical protein
MRFSKGGFPVFRLWWLVSIFALAAVLLLPEPAANKPVYADENLDKLCVPVTKDLGSDNHEPTGWLQVQFINRAVIRLQYSGTGDCASPPGRDAEFINGDVKFGDLLNGDYYDNDTGDGNFDYVKQDGASGVDDSRVDNFGGGLDGSIGDRFGGQDRAINADTIRQHIADVEFVIGIEEDRVPGVSCTGTNDNFVFTNIDRDSKGFLWICRSNISSADKGLRVRNSFVGKLENFNITYNYQGGAIVHVSAGERDTRTFSWCPNIGSGQFRTNACNGDLYIESTQQQIEGLGTGTGDLAIKMDGSPGEEVVRIAGPGSVSAESSRADDRTIASDTASCESSGGPFGWLLCGLFDGALGAMRALYTKLIEPLLDVELLRGTEGDQLKEVWSSFRTIANIAFVIVFMIIIFAQASSLNIEAYTVKKVLPRLVIGVIMVQLSFFLVAIAVDVFNVLGEGVAGLINIPFRGNTNVTLSGEAAFAGLAILGAGSALLALTPLVLGVLLGVLLAVITLLFRQLLIALLIVTAPIAMVAWILPNTERFFSQWWSLLVKALVMYPIIVAFIALGNLAGNVASNAFGGVGSTVGDIMGLLALGGPYFAIPFTFKFAGGVLGQLASFAEGGLKGKRFQAYSERKGLEKGAKRASFMAGAGGKNRLTRGLSQAASFTGVGAGAYYRRLRGDKSAISAAIEANQLRAQQLRGEDKALEMIKNSGNDKAMTILGASGGTVGGAKAELRRRLAQIDQDESTGKITAPQAQASRAAWNQAYSIAQRAGFNGTSAQAGLSMWAASGYNFEAGEAGYRQLQESARRLSGGDAGRYANMMNNAQFALKNSGRYDLAGINDGAAYDFDTGYGKASMYEIANGKKQTVTAAAQHIRNLYAQGTPESIQKAYTYAVELQNSLPNAKGAVANEINKWVTGPGDGGPSLQSIIDDSRAFAQNNGLDVGQWNNGARKYREPIPGQGPLAAPEE